MLLFFSSRNAFIYLHIGSTTWYNASFWHIYGKQSTWAKLCIAHMYVIGNKKFDFRLQIGLETVLLRQMLQIRSDYLYMYECSLVYY